MLLTDSAEVKLGKDMPSLVKCVFLFQWLDYCTYQFDAYYEVQKCCHVFWHQSSDSNQPIMAQL